VDETTSGDFASPTEDADLASGFGDALRELAAAPIPAGFLPRGTVVGGHFRIDRRLGAGGMGIVYLARDTELERDVALKVHLDPTRPDALERLQLEARTMAKLAHTNVLVVHEIGTFEGRLYVAMEYVDGGTALEWSREQPRRWTEILDLYGAAARGLAAAHAVGIVHRDFKPENVLVGRDGRVRVADFGLARSFGEASGAPRTDAIAGTPAYMAPEQFDPQSPVGPATDQWAFCVALWHALHRAWPYGTRAAWALQPGDVPERPRDAAGPARLRSVLRRGLAIDPAERHRDMPALCRALDDIRARRARRGRALVLGGAVSLAAGAGIAFGMTARTDACAMPDPRPGVLWSQMRRETLEAAFVRASPLGAETWPLVSARVDDHFDGWQRELASACRGGAREDQSSVMACFDRSLARVDGLLRAWERATPGLVEHAVAHLSELDVPASCHAVTGLEAVDAEGRAELTEARARLAEASARLRDGPFDGVEETVAAALAVADAWADEALRAQSLAVLATHRARTGSNEARVDALRDAYWAARRADDPGTAVQVASVLAWTLAIELGRVEQGLEWSGHARIEVERGTVSPHLGGRLDTFEGIVRAQLGRYEDAIALHRSAVETLRRYDRVFDAGRAEIALADALDRAGRTKEALEHYGFGLEVLREAIGPGHPDVADALTNMGLALATLGRLEEATRAHQDAIALLERVHGPEHPDLLAPRMNLAIALGAQERYDEAAAVLERTMGTAREARPADHQDFGLLLAVAGWLDQRRGRLEAALVHFEQALEHNRQVLPADHPELGVNLGQIAEVLHAQGRLEDARLGYRSALEQWEAAGGAQHPRTVAVWVALAEAELALGHEDAARTAARRGLSIAEQAEVDPDLVVRAEAITSGG
jgi:eukaryotic-like serine/threonine-protein kinase